MTLKKKKRERDRKERERVRAREEGKREGGGKRGKKESPGTRLNFAVEKMRKKGLYLLESTGKIFILILVRIVYHCDRAGPG